MQGGIGPLRPSFAGAALPRAVDCHLQWLVQNRTPHFLFSGERKENGPFTVQKKRAFERCGARLWMVLLETRSPNRLASAPNPAAAAAVVGAAGSCSFDHRQQRQRKEKQIKSVMDFSLSIPPTQNFPPILSASFSLLDRPRPVFSFSSRRKRENGGWKWDQLPVSS